MKFQRFQDLIRSKINGIKQILKCLIKIKLSGDLQIISIPMMILFNRIILYHKIIFLSNLLFSNSNISNLLSNNLYLQEFCLLKFRFKIKGMTLKTKIQIHLTKINYKFRIINKCRFKIILEIHMD
jgi:hypothetical protein